MDGSTTACLKQAIRKAFTETFYRPRASSPTEFSTDFGEISYGKPGKRFIRFTKEYDLVYPVNVRVTIRRTYLGNVPETIVRGGTNSEVFFSYKDEFNQWNFRTGRL